MKRKRLTRYEQEQKAKFDSIVSLKNEADLLLADVSNNAALIKEKQQKLENHKNPARTKQAIQDLRSENQELFQEVYTLYEKALKKLSKIHDALDNDYKIVDLAFSLLLNRIKLHSKILQKDNAIHALRLHIQADAYIHDQLNNITKEQLEEYKQQLKDVQRTLVEYNPVLKLPSYMEIEMLQMNTVIHNPRHDDLTALSDLPLSEKDLNSPRKDKKVTDKPHKWDNSHHKNGSSTKQLLKWQQKHQNSDMISTNESPVSVKSN